MTTGTNARHHWWVSARRPTAVRVVASVSSVAATGAVVLAALSGDATDRLIHGHVLAGALAAITFSWIGAVVVRRLPANRVGWLCLAIGSSEALSGVITEYGRHGVVTDPGSLPAAAAIASLDGWIWMPGFAAILTLLVAWFPDGQIYRRWVRVPLGLAAAGVAAFVIPTAVMSWRLRGPAIFSADRIDDGSSLASVADAGLPLFLLGALGCLGAALGRFQRSAGRERQQLLWFASGAGLCVLALVATPNWSVAPVIELIALPLIPAAIGVALLRHRLYDIEFVLNRVLLYAGLTAVVGTLYVGMVAAATRWLDSSSVVAAVVASGIVAVGFDRIRRLLEGMADRLLFGTRHNPALAMSELTRRVAATPNADVLDAIAAGVVSAVRLRGARVEVAATSGSPLLGAAGEVATPTLALPLAFDGRVVGSLIVEADPGAPLDSADRRLLDDLAAHAGIAVRAVLLALELQHSRARLLEAVEQERRRLRRDLHDGLGTSLVGIVMQLEALANLVEKTSPAAGLVKTIETESRQLVSDTRRLVQGLAPPIVEEVGLLEAIRQHADRLNRTGGRRGTFEVQAQLSPSDRLPAAVEVAAYVIATEAMTNVARHAKANRCTVTVTQNTHLTVQVDDDGVGLTKPPGVGMRSMRERTEDLGGVLTIEAARPQGTKVLATLPLELD